MTQAEYEALAYVKDPKFQAGDKVSMRKATLYGETSGEVVEVRRVYQRVCPHTRSIDPRGLVTEESHIDMIKIPFERMGQNVFAVHYPERDYGTWVEKAKTEVSVFCGYSVLVKTPKMLTVYSEKSLKLIERPA